MNLKSRPRPAPTGEENCRPFIDMLRWVTDPVWFSDKIAQVKLRLAVFPFGMKISEYRQLYGATSAAMQLVEEGWPDVGFGVVALPNR